MISKGFIDHWQTKAAWSLPEFVEQDLILTRLLIELYSDPLIASHLAFRGGTALHKVFFKHPYRYSEDLDFVQIQAGPIGEIVSRIRQIIKPILPAKPQYDAREGRVILRYSYVAEYLPSPRMKIKIEINTREHFTLMPLQHLPMTCHSPWFTGHAALTTYQLEEMLATKLRALYQRRKGRDLFDLFMARELAPDYQQVVEIFKAYLKAEENTISHANFLQNLEAKMQNPAFFQDMQLLIAPHIAYDSLQAIAWVQQYYLSHLAS